MAASRLIEIDAGVASILHTATPGQLSRRELEVLQNLQLGLTNRQIAQRLFISTNTVNKHVQRVLRKLEVSNRVQAAIYARGSMTW